MRQIENNKDRYFMQKALGLARKAFGKTSPNPLVGAVIVKNNKIIGQGFHRKCGLAHAEIEAFKSARKSCSGATLYVNLEPCCHFGRTGPCVDEVIKQKIKRVVVAASDPNPLVAGKSIKKMRTAGIDVTEGICADDARRLNEVFFTNMKKNRAFAAIKWAQSLDGKTVSRTGVSKWITSKQARNYARRLRDNYAAVLVGINTVLADNPKLQGNKKIVYKIVLDPEGQLTNKFICTKENPEKLIIITIQKYQKQMSARFMQARIIICRNNKHGFDLKQILRKLYEIGIVSVFIEGGSETIGKFFDACLADKVYVFIAPKILGGAEALTAVKGQGFALPRKCPQLKNIGIQRIGNDFMIFGYPKFN